MLTMSSQLCNIFSLRQRSPWCATTKMQISIILSIAFFLSIFMFLSSAMEFVYDGFGGSTLKLSGQAAVLSSGVLQLTNDTSRVLGRSFHPRPLRISTNASSFSFSMTFVFSMVPQYPALGGHGLAFVMAPSLDFTGAMPSQYMGLDNASTNGNKSNHFFAVEFDTVQDFEFRDVDGNHVGIDLNSLVSVASEPLERHGINLKSGEKIQAWVDCGGSNSSRVDVRVAAAGSERPARPLLSGFIDLKVVMEENMYVGFSASTGLLSSTQKVFGWSFSTDGPAKDLELPKFSAQTKRRRRLIIIIVPCCIALAVLLSVVAYFYLFRRRGPVEERELKCEPRKFAYRELRAATKGFRENELLGKGGFGRVYRGVLPGGQEVAVKRVSHDSRQGLREFLAEISSLGRIRHRNLVRLLGWCHSRRKGELLLVYDHMPGGSLDKLLFDNNSSGDVLSWRRRRGILRGVAAALVYLHEECELRVVHRDVKASNVLLDRQFNGRLGDFGLARLYDHGKHPQTTKVVGTLGYVAPELTRTGKATASSDVYSFGALLLEVACGRRPVDPRRCDEEMVLVEWVWGFQQRGAILEASDRRLVCCEDYDAAEVEVVLKLGLLCSLPVPERRPTMRQALQVLYGEAPLLPLPPQMPVMAAPLPPVFPRPMPITSRLTTVTEEEGTLTGKKIVGQ
uniref:non-specific serine/threonine protein kinase n=1 Tax=Araucaria cunninghamii TaxID=56994 RepID=A0A0D6QS71_ARACU